MLNGTTVKPIVVQSMLSGNKNRRRKKTKNTAGKKAIRETEL